MMSRRARLAPFAILISSVVSASGCTEPEATFYFEQLLQPETEEVDMVTVAICDPEGDTGAESVSASTNNFYGCARLRNQLIERADPDKPQVETNNIIVYEVEVVVEKGGNEIGAFTEPLSNFVPAANTNGFFIPVVNRDIFDDLDAGDSVVAFVVARGRTTGGVNVETPEFAIPVLIYK